MTEIASVPATRQRMLDVPRNRRVDVKTRRLFVLEGRIGLVRTRIVEVRVSTLEQPAIPDVLVDVLDSQQPAILAERHEGGVEEIGTVEQLLVDGHPEPQRVRAREDDLHPRHRVDVREERCSVNKILRQRDLVNENIPNSLRLQCVEPVRHIVQSVAVTNLEIRGL